MSIWGIKVSKPGFDVGTASGTQLVMSSEINTLKTFKSQELEASELVHNFGYVPIHLYAYFPYEKMSNITFIGQADFTENYGSVTAGTATISDAINTEMPTKKLVYCFYDSL